MRERSRQLILLALAAIAFATMIALVATGVSLRRASRDLTFGLEELDALLAGGDADDEVAAMISWLAGRARTVAEGLRVLKRAHLLYERTGSVEPLAEASSVILEEFPANTTVAAIAAFAEVRAGRPRAALAIARERLETVNPAVYAWTLLSASVVPESDALEPEASDDRTDAGPASPAGEVLLVGLGPESSADDFARAWELTGDPRYALDAVLIRLRDRDTAGATELASRAGLVARYPLFVAQLLLDGGRYREAAEILERRAPSSREARLLLADAYLYAGENEAARRLYTGMLDDGESPVEAYLNLAWLAADRETAVELIGSAGGVSDEWELDRARVLLGAGEARSLVERWSGTIHEGNALLVELRLDPDLDRRGYPADLWLLLERFPTPDAHRFAAWYFATRGRTEDVRIVLDRAAARRSPDEPEPAWSLHHRGMLSAGRGDWAHAATLFERGFVSAPTWAAALNAALARFRTGDRNGGEARLQDALLLARNTGDRRSVAVFLAAARASRSDGEMREYVAEALRIDPGLPDALLLAAQLENPGGR